MAEIRIEKKKPIWPWVLVILIILAAIFFFWYYNDKDFDHDDLYDNDTLTEVDTNYGYGNQTADTTYIYKGRYGAVATEHAFADYFDFVDHRDSNLAADNTYYRTAFFKLITATKREAEIQNIDVTTEITSAMENAEKLNNDPKTAAKATTLKKAADDVTKALKKIQKQDFDNLSSEIADLEKSVSNIDGNQTFENQTNQIDAFFDKAAQVLQKMYESDNQ